MSGCTNRWGGTKKRYCREAAAAFVAGYWTSVYGIAMDWYSCPDCEQWHVYTKRDSPKMRNSTDNLVDNETDNTVVS